jgi:hypothetical protein
VSLGDAVHQTSRAAAGAVPPVPVPPRAHDRFQVKISSVQQVRRKGEREKKTHQVTGAGFSYLELKPKCQRPHHWKTAPITMGS